MKKNILLYLFMLSAATIASSFNTREKKFAAGKNNRHLELHR